MISACVVYMELQRDPLDDQFDELFAGITDELLDETGNHTLECDKDADDILVAEYVSDDDTTTSSSVEDEDDGLVGHHVTKVCYKNKFLFVYMSILDELVLIVVLRLSICSLSSNV